MKVLRGEADITLAPARLRLNVALEQPPAQLSPSAVMMRRRELRSGGNAQRRSPGFIALGRGVRYVPSL